jgi:hypothetical protein
VACGAALDERRADEPRQRGRVLAAWVERRCNLSLVALARCAEEVLGAEADARN